MQATRTGWSERVRHIIFDHNTPESRAIDVGLLALIVLGVLLVMLETVEELEVRYDALFHVLEWIITRASSRKIIVFLIVVLLIDVIAGCTMYLVEGPENGYDSMFRGVYWVAEVASSGRPPGGILP